MLGAPSTVGGLSKAGGPPKAEAHSIAGGPPMPEGALNARGPVKARWPPRLSFCFTGLTSFTLLSVDLKFYPRKSDL